MLRFHLSTSLDLYKLAFMAALFAAETMLLIRLPKKSRYPLRMIVAFCVMLLAAALYPTGENTALTSSLMFGLFFGLSIFLSKWCYRITWHSCLFCTVAGYSIQHVSSIIYNMITTVGAFDQSTSVYSGAPLSIDLLSLLVFVQVYLFIYYIMYHLFVKRIRINEQVTITSRALLGLICMMLLVEIFLNAFVVYHRDVNLDLLYYLCACTTNLLCSICVLIILFGQLLRSTLESELEIVNQLRRQEKNHYDLTKETIDMINVRCHDMKHQIHRIRHSAVISTEALKEVERSIGIYDSMVKTGCDALDVILAEKSMFCQKNGISINCIVDGEKLGFMSEMDIYSLFGNLLVNALHSVMKLEEEKRTIFLRVKAKGRLLSINSYNPYAGELYMQNGIPQTTQTDRTAHGFGIKSMSMIVAKYGGTMTFNTENQTFSVSMLFPLTDAEPANTQERHTDEA
nr:sensor histidine kinase [Clostridia bacterium]